jgi:hypothetical protein
LKELIVEILLVKLFNTGLAVLLLININKMLTVRKLCLNEAYRKKQNNKIQKKKLISSSKSIKEVRLILKKAKNKQLH